MSQHSVVSAFISALWIHAICGSVSFQAEQILPIPLNSYRDPSKLVYGRITVPEYSTETIFRLSVAVSGNCDVPEILWSFAHNRYPYVNFLNGSSPSYVRIMANDFDRITNSSMDTEQLINPKFGDWFWAVTINQLYHESMTQSGIASTSDCEFRAMFYTTNTVEARPLYISMNTDFYANITSKSSVVYRFQPPPGTISVRLQIISCKYNVSSKLDVNPCPVIVTYSQNRMPSTVTADNVPSTSGINTTLKYLRQDDLNFIRVTNFEFEPWITVQMRLVPVHDCALMEEVMKPSDPQQGNCIISPPLNRFVYFMSRFRFYFTNTETTDMSNWMILKLDINRMIMPFMIRHGEDQGGTLMFAIKAATIKSSDVEVRVYGCLSDTIHLGNLEDPCSIRLNTSSKSGQGAVTYIPYPRIGLSYVSIWRECFLEDNPVVCPNSSFVLTTLESQPCIGGKCGDYGICSLVQSRDIQLGACQCRWGYTGFGCTDGTNKISFSVEMIKLLCLTISNIFFIPAIVMALRRRLYVQSLVYFYIMLFSTLYHMCDSNTPYSTCVMKYDTLSFCDFYGAAMAMWVTLIAVSGLSRGLAELLSTAAALGLVIGIVENRHGLLAFLIPLVIGAAIVLACWARHWWSRRTCYPRRKWWLMGMLPGFICAASGMVLYAFYQTTYNYAYVHSAWHVLISLAIVFILPWSRGPPLFKRMQCLGFNSIQHSQETNQSPIFDTDRVSMDSNVPPVDSDWIYGQNEYDRLLQT